MSEEEKQMLDYTRQVVSSNLDNPNGVEIIKNQMNNMYKYFKTTITTAKMPDQRLFEIFNIERLMSNKFLPLNSEPIYSQDEQIQLPTTINDENDCKAVMDFIVHQARKEINSREDVKTSPLTKMCVSSSSDVEKICTDLGVENRRFSCSENLSPGVFHCFNTVNFNLPNGENKMYLVDCTYRQFFTYADSFVEKIGLLYNEGANMGAFMMMDESRKSMAEELLTKGYVEFTPENIKNYFDGFVFNGRNGKYYEQLNKPMLEKSDFEPQYNYVDYLEAINNKGLENEPYIGRQIGVLNSPISFENDYIRTNSINK